MLTEASWRPSLARHLKEISGGDITKGSVRLNAVKAGSRLLGHPQPAQHSTAPPPPRKGTMTHLLNE